MYSVVIYIMPAFDLLLHGLNARHSKYMPKELGQVTPV